MKRAALLAVVICAALGAALGAVQSSSGSAYAGTWAGTWEGPGTGQFDMTIENGKDGPTGRVAVTTDNGNYNADLKAIVFDGNKMTAKYDFPLDPSAEVAVTATFEARTAKGTWSLRAKGQDG